MIEIWKFVIGYENLYEVSNLGNIRAVERVMPYNRNKQFEMIKKQRTIYPNKDSGGYSQVSLRKNNKRCNYKLHRLVAEIFIPNPDNKPQVNHIDGNKSNNNINNLEWVTSAENMVHAVSIGLIKKKLNKFQVRIIRRLKDDMPQPEIANLFGICQQSVSDILTRKCWKHI